MTAIQKAREALEAVKTALARHDLALARREHGDVAAGHCIDDIRSALAALDAETPATPADVGEEPVAWQRRQRYALRVNTVDADPWRECSAAEATGHFERKPGYEYRPLYSATALERVVRERDEARELAQMFSQVSKKPEWIARAESAEAKLAEAREVIERIRSEAGSWAASYSFARQIADIAHRFLKETK